MKKLIGRLTPVFIILPFIIGTIGYLAEGEGITDAMYASFALYFVNPVNDDGNILINAARWLAALALITTVLDILKEGVLNIFWRVRCMLGKSAAVYCDGTRVHFDNTAVIYPDRSVKSYADIHIIMFASDTKSLEFYSENKAVFKGHPVYIGLSELECALVKDESDVTFFDVNGSAARCLWKDIGLWRRARKNWEISIYGSRPLGQNILNYGLLLNLFSVKQKIKYNFICDDDKYRLRHGEIKTASSDTVVYYDVGNEASWEAMARSDIVIVSEEVEAETLQTVCDLCRRSEIYFYSPKEESLVNFLGPENLHTFGEESKIFTEDNIRREKLLENAKRLNAGYAAKYGSESDWKKLSVFLKWSNISSADFGEVMTELISSGINNDQEELAELEHIRWCRFHYLNYWEYGEPEDGSNRDETRRIHRCLIPYSKLSETEKDKDRAAIENAKTALYSEN